MNEGETAEQLILVDARDNPVGYETKLRAHERGGRLHRAFSIFIFDDLGRMLLQRRAREKYHFGGLWSNACCGHPTKGEMLLDAAHRRLREELGFDTDLEEVFGFVYRATDPESGLTEHEFDHVLIGGFGGTPRPDPREVEGWMWADVRELMADVEVNPRRYTPWFGMVVKKVLDEPRPRDLPKSR